MRSESKICEQRELCNRRVSDPREPRHWQTVRWDPKDGELCLGRAKPEETLVEARSGSDVQIDRLIWV